MKCKMRFFASLKEAVKTASLELELPADIDTIGALRTYLAAQSPVWEEALAPHKNIRAAQNLEMVTMQTPLQEGLEIAFFPPVTGG